MAQLRGLGQPFGSPGGIINIPAPAGSQLAGQIQMQAMQGLGQALGNYLRQRQVMGLEQEDVRRVQSMPQTQDIFNTMYGARGMQAPQAQVPQMVSPRGREAQFGGMLQTQFGDPFGIQRTKAGLQQAQTISELTPKPMLPTQKAAQARLDIYNKAKAIPSEKRTKYQQKVVEDFELRKPLVSVSIGDKAVTNTLSLRREFQADPRIKDMRIIDKFTANVVTAYKRSLTSKNLGPVDISLAKSFQKLTDLGSSVREGEFATTFAGQKLINKIRGKAQAVIKGGLGFTPEDRKEIRDLVLLLQKDSQVMYNQAYDEIGITADEFGFNKRAIFGGTKRYDIQSGLQTPVGQLNGLTPTQQKRRNELRRKAGL